MFPKRLTWLLFLSLFSSACTSNRTVSAPVVIANESRPPAQEGTVVAQASPPVEPAAPAPEPSPPPADPIAVLIEPATARQLFQKSLELQALTEPAEMGQPIAGEIAPLDELAELNLFTMEVDPHLRELVSGDLLQSRYEIPVVLNDSVLRFLNYYQSRGRHIMERGLKRSGRYLQLFREIFRREDLPLDLVYMAHVESLFNPRAYSRARAKGLWQFVKWTGAQKGLRQDWWIDERSDILRSTEAAARYLKELYASFGDWHLVLAAYNVGPGRIERILNRYGPISYWTMAGRRLLPRETINHVPSVLAALIIFRHPERYGFQVECDPEVAFETVPVAYQVDLRVVSELAGVPLEELKELNPELLRGVTPQGYPEYVLKVPLGKAEILQRQLAAWPPEKRLVLQHHRVKSGETLSLIAKKYSVPVRVIAQANQVRNIHRLSLGQDLVIPISGWVAPLQETPALPGSHVVRRGDSLEKIAGLYGVTVRDLLAWNHLKPGALIYPGQKIKILAEAAAAEVLSTAEPFQ